MEKEKYKISPKDILLGVLVLVVIIMGIYISELTKYSVSNIDSLSYRIVELEKYPSPTISGIPSEVPDETRPYHIHGDGSIHYEDTPDYQPGT